MRIVRPSFLVALAVSLAGLVPVDIAAQPSLMIGGGSSRPGGDMGDLLQTGYHGRAGIQLGVPSRWWTYHKFDAGSTSGAVGGSMTQVDGTMSVVLQAGFAGIGPYFLGGVGRHRQEYSDEFNRPEAETERGWHGGVGFTFGLLGLNSWVEARFVSIDSAAGDAKYVPVSFGIRF